MADWGQFEDLEAEGTAQRPAGCQVCEAMLPDAVDGTLSEAEQRAFDRHVAGCVECARELEEAQRGAAWLGLLKQQAPEPNAMLLDRILAETTGARATHVAAASEPEVTAAAPAWAAALLPSSLPEVSREAMLPQGRAEDRKTSVWKTMTGAFSLDWMRPMLQPRMAMTAAMAFFSIALTLNLTGVRLNSLSAAALRPSTLRRTVADRSAAAVRSFQNMRVVYQTEAQVSDLRSNWQAQDEEQGRKRPAQDAPDTPKQDEPKQPDADKQPGKDTPQGSSQLDFRPVPVQGIDMTRKGA